MAGVPVGAGREDTTGGGEPLSHPRERQAYVVVIASAAKQSRATRAALDCFVAAARRLAMTPPYNPPVTSMVTPVTKSASAEARKAITRAWSAASAMRRSGMRAISAA